MICTVHTHQNLLLLHRPIRMFYKHMSDIWLCHCCLLYTSHVCHFRCEPVSNVSYFVFLVLLVWHYNSPLLLVAHPFHCLEINSHVWIGLAASVSNRNRTYFSLLQMNIFLFKLYVTALRSQLRFHLDQLFLNFSLYYYQVFFSVVLAGDYSC